MSDVSKLYKLPICDCTFTSEKLYVHFRIAIVTKSENCKICELLTTPFVWYNQTCFFKHETHYSTISDNVLTGTNKTKQILGIVLRQCNSFDNKLCYLSLFAADTAHGPGCAEILYTDSSISEINQHCPLHRIISQLLYISDICEDIFDITHPHPCLRLQCNNCKKTFFQRYLLSPNVAFVPIH